MIVSNYSMYSVFRIILCCETLPLAPVNEHELFTLFEYCFKLFDVFCVLKLFYDSYSLVLHFCALLLLSFFFRSRIPFFFLFRKSVIIPYLPRGKLEKKNRSNSDSENRAAPPPHVRKPSFLCVREFVPCRAVPHRVRKPWVRKRSCTVHIGEVTAWGLFHI
jgi:hypothetical protein